MKTKKLTPRNAAPVQRENTATVSRGEIGADGHAIAPLWDNSDETKNRPFAGDDAE